jgi:cell division protein FtsQ
MGREHSATGLLDSGSEAAGAADQRRRGPWKAVLFAAAAAAIVAAAVWGLLGSSLLVVRTVAVHTVAARGSAAAPSAVVPRAEVLRAARVEPGTPLARVNTAAVARRVERITQVQSATVARDWPDALVITIRTRTPELAVPSGRGFALVDTFGVVVRQVASRPAGMVVLYSAPPAPTLRGSPAVRAAVTVLQQLPPRIRRLVRWVAAPSAGAVTLHLRGGVRVLWGGTDRPSGKAAELTILMRSKALSYDLSDPTTAVTGG